MKKRYLYEKQNKKFNIEVRDLFFINNTRICISFIRVTLAAIRSPAQHFSFRTVHGLSLVSTVISAFSSIAFYFLSLSLSPSYIPPSYLGLCWLRRRCGLLLHGYQFKRICFGHTWGGVVSRHETNASSSLATHPPILYLSLSFSLTLFLLLLITRNYRGNTMARASASQSSLMSSAENNVSLGWAAIPPRRRRANRIRLFILAPSVCQKGA